MSEQTNRPKFSNRIGGVEVAVFYINGHWSITTQKHYKDTNGQWKQTNFLSAGEALAAQSLLGDAVNYIKRRTAVVEK